MFPRLRHVKKVSLGLAAGAAVLLLSAGQAQAHSGSGTFTGYEIPPENVTLAQGTICATFHSSANDPLIHELDMDGTFHGVDGAGTATFTYDRNWFAGPEGTYTSASCHTRGSITGDMTIVFENWSCTGTGTYERRQTTAYTLSFSGSCDDTSTGTVEATATTASFGGTQVLCSVVSCANPNAGSKLDGSYSQTG